MLKTKDETTEQIYKMALASIDYANNFVKKNSKIISEYQNCIYELRHQIFEIMYACIDEKNETNK